MITMKTPLINYSDWSEKNTVFEFDYLNEQVTH